jgi:predicted NodU family carbamoyl transferase
LEAVPGPEATRPVENDICCPDLIHMLILGLSPPKRDASAALLSERGLETAIEESKLVRSRGFSGVPRGAVECCLDKTNVSWSDISIVAFAKRWFNRSPRRSI